MEIAAAGDGLDLVAVDAVLFGEHERSNRELVETGLRQGQVVIQLHIASPVDPEHLHLDLHTRRRDVADGVVDAVPETRRGGEPGHAVALDGVR